MSITILIRISLTNYIILMDQKSIQNVDIIAYKFRQTLTKTTNYKLEVTRKKNEKNEKNSEKAENRSYDRKMLQKQKKN